MEITISSDLPQVARQLNLSMAGVQRTVELLEEGNTVPFITRYRKDQTGGLDEEQIRRIDDTVATLRQLAERKRTILKSIESQQKLTSELAELISSAKSLKLLEDLYLPYRPKKQTLATLARQRGLEPLACEVLEAEGAVGDLSARAADFVDPENQLPTADDVLTGVRHLLAERFSENARLRGRLRKIIWRTGKLVSKRCETPETKISEGADEAKDETPDTPADARPTAPDGTDAGEPDVENPKAPPPEASIDAPKTDNVTAPASEPEAAPPTEPSVGTAEPVATETAGAASPADSAVPDQNAAEIDKPSAAGTAPSIANRREQRKEARERKKKKLLQSFKDYFDYREPLGRIPPHRVLAVNRGERARVLRVKIEVDQDKLRSEAEQLLVPAEHPHADFLRGCVADALSRLILPSLDREVRRELTDKAEAHAVDVFARNLRKLLLQPPLHGKRVLAIDPGFRSGCKLVTLDEFGNLLGHGTIYLVGNEKKRQASRSRLLEMIRDYKIAVVVIGNGTACRETEQLIAGLLAEELKDHDVAYAIANEAGASVYSTSDVGREELPDCDPMVRGSVSIGRRVLDPLSELVKINPANIGVGLYQHDIKTKPLRASLDHVVESCVNYVGVDVNTASPALLAYVSGLNQLTARRLYEYRKEHGPFRGREQVREVPGIGEATYIQAAGFLKIIDGDNPLDATWIHPESYEIAQQVLEKTGCSVSDLDRRVVKDQPPEAPADRPTDAVAPAMAPSEATHDDPITTGEVAATDAPPGTPALSAEAAVSTDSQPPADDTQHSAPALSADPAASNRLTERLASADVEQLSEELQVGKLLLQDILVNLARPGRDPREDLSPPVFRRSILKLEDLQPNMELSGTVVNVVDFGAFVDIGLSDSGLIHVSRMADRFVSDPHEVVSVGEVVKVWVVDIDKQRRRVSLTAIQPGTEKPREARRSKPAPATPKNSEQQTSRRPPRHKPSAAGAKAHRATRSRPARHTTPKRPRQPVVPITDKMAEGQEPMRTFSDLKQFFDKKDEPPPQSDLDQHNDETSADGASGES